LRWRPSTRFLFVRLRTSSPVPQWCTTNSIHQPGGKCFRSVSCDGLLAPTARCYLCTYRGSDYLPRQQGRRRRHSPWGCNAARGALLRYADTVHVVHMRAPIGCPYSVFCLWRYMAFWPPSSDENQDQGMCLGGGRALLLALLRACCPSSTPSESPPAPPLPNLAQTHTLCLFNSSRVFLLVLSGQF
jgi:hypothetical protein